MGKSTTIKLKKYEVPKLGQKVGNGVVTQVIKVGKGTKTLTVTPTMYPKWKFKAEIKSNKLITKRGVLKEYWAVIVARNGEIVFTGETRKRKSALIKTINNLFPGVVIIDKTTK